MLQIVAAAHSGEMGARLKKAGAKVGALTCSLLWNTEDDLDLHCETPTGAHISWQERTGTCGGTLDGDHGATLLTVTGCVVSTCYCVHTHVMVCLLGTVDMNASENHLTTQPIENMYWDEPPPGNYRFSVVCEARRQSVSLKSTCATQFVDKQ
jgi:uncharacterized protein YfaP (DUF2135 family)